MALLNIGRIICCLGLVSAMATTSIAGERHRDVETLARLQCVIDGEECPQDLIRKMRRMGPDGLEHLFAVRELIQEDVARAGGSHGWRLERIDRLIDMVGGQRYCTASRLFWYTDLAAAKAAALEAGKPILSLRMLGALTDEYSCANSRFFRTVLYPNAKVSAYLREHFVLHWQSERRVPQVTVDFGDGRVMRRTLAGNSIHYALTSDGKVLDGLPGLYSPQAFQAWLERMTQLHKESRRWDAAEYTDNLGRYHEEASRRNQNTLTQDMIRAGLPQVVRLAESGTASAKDGRPPSAKEAVPLAPTKSGIEIRLIGAPAFAVESPDDVLWQQLAELHSCALDDNSLKLIRQLHPTHGLSVVAAEGDALDEIVAALQRSIALDTVKNEYQMHRQIHEWFVDGRARHGLEPLNSLVYAELFLTPATDPWLGLLTKTDFLALENNGIQSASELEALVAGKSEFSPQRAPTPGKDQGDSPFFVPGQLTEDLLSGRLNLEDLPH